MLEQRQMRLLHVSPSNGVAIVCNTSIVPLLSSPPYDALSYTWGSQDVSHEICLSGKPFRVSTNLYSALKYFSRKNDEEHTIWVDAICIEQRNDGERTSQVAIMDEIYRRARKVVMWVGEATESDIMAFTLLEELSEVFQQNGHIDFDFQLTGPDGRECPGYGLPNSDAKEWNALARLFSRPYFQRIWVIQEVVVATQAVLTCGKFTIQWELVRDLARSVQKGGSLGMLEYEETAPGIVSVNVMADLKAGNGIDLLSLLAKTRAYEATEPRDKVFALMNIVSNHQDVGFRVDYSMEAPDLWRKLATHSLTVHKSFLCLSNAGIHSSSLQSWVPDWSNTNEHRGCLALYGNGHYRACGETTILLSVSNDVETLVVEGFVVDTVAVVAPSIFKFTPRKRNTGPLISLTKEENEARTEKIFNEFKNVEAAATSAFLYVEGEARDREIARSWCCDLLTTGEAANLEGAYEVYKWWIRSYNLYASLSSSNETEIAASLREIKDTKPSKLKMEPFMHAAVLFGTGRSLCTTLRGDLGRVPFGTQAGDLICIFKGGFVPYLLRADNGYYKLIGECFINGMMYGEALGREGLTEQRFEIK